MAWHGSKPNTLIGGKSRRQFCLRATLRARLPTPDPRGSAKRTVTMNENHGKERNNEHVWNTPSSATGRDSTGT
jgi:hypothetical protein